MPHAPDLAPFHAHGGRVEAARLMFGGTDWTDLSTGIAPWAWPVGDRPLGFDRLPEPDAIAALEAAAASALGIADAARVVAVPGTDLALRLLALILNAQRPAVVRPGYAGHAAAWPEARAVSPDRLDAVAGDLLVLASPANPDGRVIDPATLCQLAERMTVVVDEAYADPGPGSCANASDRLVVLRSFGKFYGLPGVRLGFVVAGERISGQLRTIIGDWPVSGPAVAIGTVAYADAEWRDAQRRRIEGIGAALDRLLAAAGLTVVGRAPLFRLIECADAAALFTRLARGAVLTRPFADRPRHLRIGLPRDEAALARLEELAR